MSGGLGWIRTINLPIQRRALCWLSYKALLVERNPGLAPGKNGFAIRRLDAFGMSRVENGETSGICTRHDGFHRAGCCSYIMASIEKWIRPFDALRFAHGLRLSKIPSVSRNSARPE